MNAEVFKSLKMKIWRIWNEHGNKTNEASLYHKE
jgi:hypothetical protein